MFGAAGVERMALCQMVTQLTGLCHLTHEHVFLCEQSQSDLGMWTQFSLHAQKGCMTGGATVTLSGVTTEGAWVPERARGQAALWSPCLSKPCPTQPAQHLVW